MTPAPFEIIGGIGTGEGTKWFKGKKFKGLGLLIIDFPIITPQLTFSPGIEYVEMLTYPSGERGH